MTTATPNLTTVSGTIKRYSASGSGLILAELDQWFNFSKFGPAAELPHPEPGSAVVLAVNDRNYIQQLHIVSAAGAVAAAAASAAPALAPVTARDAADLAGALSGAELRELRIIRQACLKVAADYYRTELNQLADGTAAQVGELLALAEVFESWVLR